MNYPKGEVRLRKALSFIIAFIQEQGVSPSMREIADGAGVKSVSHAGKIVGQLEKMDVILREKNKNRTIRILDEAYIFLGLPLRRLEETFLIPMLGKIVASAPIPIPDSSFNLYDAESRISVLSSELPQNAKIGELFALEVDGDSMIDSLVNDGDIVIVRPVKEVQNGDMVAARLKDGNETTLKHIIYKDDHVVLRPANPTMEDIIVDPDNIEVQGKVVLVKRKL